MGLFSAAAPGKAPGYFGSKNGAGVKERIIAAMPPHDTYIELFLGSGAVMRAKPPAQLQIGVEANAAAVAKYNYPEGAQIITGNALEYLQSFEPKSFGQTLIYCDPPYVHATRSKSRKYGKYELSDLEHKFLCEHLNRAAFTSGAKVMLSGYDNEIYRMHLKDFHRLDYQVMTRGGPRTESLWTSFVIGEAAHWHSYAGENKAHRQQIKRKAGRWAKNYENATPGERLALMAALMEVEARLQGS